MFSGLSPNLRGILAMSGASAAFTFNDTLVKVATKFWPTSQVMAVRGIFAMTLALTVIAASGKLGRVGVICQPLVIARTITEATVALLFISALAHMPLADVTSILMISPLAITGLAIVFYGEVVRWRRWAAIIVGFIGMLLVIQPGGAAMQSPAYALSALLAGLSVIGVACRDLITRKLSSDIPTIIVMLATSIGSMCAGFMMTFWQPWRAFDVIPVLSLLAAAVILNIGNYLSILSCRGVDLSVVSPFRYSGVIYALVLGYSVFGDIPSALSLIGMVLIVGSGVYAVHRERIRKREAALADANPKG